MGAVGRADADVLTVPERAATQASWRIDTPFGEIPSELDRPAPHANGRPPLRYTTVN
jgi:hypothetical protein